MTDSNSVRDLATRIISKRKTSYFLDDLKERARKSFMLATVTAIGALFISLAIWVKEPSESHISAETNKIVSEMLNLRKESEGLSPKEIEKFVYENANDLGIRYENGNIVRPYLDRKACDVLIEQFPTIADESPEGPSAISCADRTLAIQTGKQS